MAAGRGPGQQRRPDQGLQLGDGLTYRRRGEVTGPGGGGHRTVVDHGDENIQ